MYIYISTKTFSKISRIDVLSVIACHFFKGRDSLFLAKVGPCQPAIYPLSNAVLFPKVKVKISEAAGKVCSISSAKVGGSCQTISMFFTLRRAHLKASQNPC